MCELCVHDGVVRIVGKNSHHVYLVTPLRSDGASDEKSCSRVVGLFCTQFGTAGGCVGTIHVCWRCSFLCVLLVSSLVAVTVDAQSGQICLRFALSASPRLASPRSLVQPAPATATTTTEEAGEPRPQHTRSSTGRQRLAPLPLPPPAPLPASRRRAARSLARGNNSKPPLPSSRRCNSNERRSTRPATSGGGCSVCAVRPLLGAVECWAVRGCSRPRGKRGRQRTLALAAPPPPLQPRKGDDGSTRDSKRQRETDERGVPYSLSVLMLPSLVSAAAGTPFFFSPVPHFSLSSLALHTLPPVAPWLPPPCLAVPWSLCHPPSPPLASCAA